MLGSDEGDTCALIARSTRPPSTMYIIFHMIRGIVIDDELELFDVQSSGRNGSCDDDRNDAGFKICYRRVPINLVFATMK